MRIQAALDYNLTMDDAMRIIDATKDSVEVFEIGTPFLRTQGGLDCVHTIREKYPDLTIYADTKITNEGARSNIPGTAYEVAAQAIKAGANIVTVMAVCDDEVIRSVIQAGRDFGGEVLVDLMDIEDVVARTLELDTMEPDYISVNTLYVGHPENEVPGVYQPLIDLERITPHLKHARATIQGGVTRENLPDICKFKPSMICIGRGIYAAEDPGQAAAEFKAILDAAQ